MAIIKMSVHRCLAELKRLDDKIENTMNLSYIGACKSQAKSINGMSVEDFKKDIVSNFDSITSLFSNRNRIKDAIINSNATTKVNVGGIEMTVAQAIERKNSILAKERFLSILKNHYTGAVNFVNQENERLQSKLEQYLSVVLGEKDKRNADDVKLHTDAFNKTNEAILIDPKNIKSHIDKLENEIRDFRTNVDYVLSESNAVTILEIELED